MQTQDKQECALLDLSNYIYGYHFCNIPRLSPETVLAIFQEATAFDVTDKQETDKMALME